jgi:hypothetical protein
MTLNEEDITAEVYHQSNGVYYIKVELLGMYISGITARISPKFPEKGLWVQMPAYLMSGSWKKYIEFSKLSPLKFVIEDKCKKAVEQTTTQPNETDTVYIPTDEELNNPEAGLDEAISKLDF